MKIRSYLRGLGAGLFISAVLMGIAAPKGADGISDDEIKQRAKKLGMVEEDSVLVKPGTEETVSADETIKIEQDIKETDKTGADKPVTDDVNKSANTDTEKTISDTKNEVEKNIKQESTEQKSSEQENSKQESTGQENAKQESTDKAVKGGNEDRAMGGQSGVSKPDTGTSDTGPAEAKPSDKKADSGSDTVTESINNEGSGNDYFTLQIAGGSSSDTVAKLLKKGGVIDDAEDFDDFLCKNHYDKKINHGVFKIPAGADYETIAGIITGAR